jgi:hypothetical protein
MNIHNLFFALTITLLIILLSAAGCMLTVSPPETVSLTGTDNISGTDNVSATDNISGSDNISTIAPPGKTSTGSVSTAATPLDNTTIGNDPVSGQNEEIDLRWEQLCLSSEYQVQIAKDPGFTIIVLDTGSYAPADVGSPGAYYPAGGRAASPSSLTSWANLEAGHTYYWRARVRQAATGQQMLSPWSEVQSFAIK